MRPTKATTGSVSVDFEFGQRTRAKSVNPPAHGKPFRVHFFATSRSGQRESTSQAAGFETESRIRFTLS